MSLPFLYNTNHHGWHCLLHCKCRWFSSHSLRARCTNTCYTPPNILPLLFATPFAKIWTKYKYMCTSTSKGDSNILQHLFIIQMVVLQTWGKKVVGFVIVYKWTNHWQISSLKVFLGLLDNSNQHHTALQQTIWSAELKTQFTCTWHSVYSEISLTWPNSIQQRACREHTATD